MIKNVIYLTIQKRGIKNKNYFLLTGSKRLKNNI